MAHRYTNEQKEFIKTNIVGKTSNELTHMVNEHFQLNLGINQIRAFIKNHKLKSGLDSCFKKGHTPFNKGKKGIGGWEPTQFKKGHKPHNYKPVGTERINSEGYLEVKIADPAKWKMKHVLVWEEANGPIPKGHVVIFGDGNQSNIHLENLILVSRKQLLVLNRHNLIQKDAELTKTGVILADIYGKISERKKG